MIDTVRSKVCHQERVPVRWRFGHGKVCNRSVSTRTILDYNGLSPSL